MLQDNHFKFMLSQPFIFSIHAELIPIQLTDIQDGPYICVIFLLFTEFNFSVLASIMVQIFISTSDKLDVNILSLSAS